MPQPANLGSIRFSDLAGVPLATVGAGKFSESTMENVPTSEEQAEQTSGGSPESRPPNAPTNDNSNPQQGSGGLKSQGMAAPTQPIQVAQRPDFKIPPTKKDARKLFVGGLPSDGTLDILVWDGPIISKAHAETILAIFLPSQLPTTNFAVFSSSLGLFWIRL